MMKRFFYMSVRKLIPALSTVVVLILGTFSAIQAVAAGDAQAGKLLIAACSACHGQDGATGLDPTYPNLAGQNEKYLIRQLLMIQDGTRQVALMAGQLIGKTEQNIADMAAYYARLPGKKAQAEGDDEAIANATMIFRAGVARKGVAACSACHSPNGLGNDQAGFPRLSGQPTGYTIAQLTAYRESTRKTDDDFSGMMRDVAEGLTDTEIAQLADYIRGLY
jgi:cytochrome c553